MVLPIDNLYEMSFHLIYLLRIQPSEVNNLTVPESRSYIRLYDEVKKREREAYEEHKANKSKNNTIVRKAPKRSYKRR